MRPRWNGGKKNDTGKYKQNEWKNVINSKQTACRTSFIMWYSLLPHNFRLYFFPLFIFRTLIIFSFRFFFLILIKEQSWKRAKNIVLQNFPDQSKHQNGTNTRHPYKLPTVFIFRLQKIHQITWWNEQPTSSRPNFCSNYKIFAILLKVLIAKIKTHQTNVLLNSVVSTQNWTQLYYTANVYGDD